MTSNGHRFSFVLKDDQQLVKLPTPLCLLGNDRRAMDALR